MENQEKPAIQEMDEVTKRQEKERLAEAVKLVNRAIDAEYKRLREIAETEEDDPIMLEGETTTGHVCRMLVDPQEVAKIVLEHDYPVWHVLEQDYPDAMWEELGRKYGLAVAYSIDL